MRQKIREAFSAGPLVFRRLIAPNAERKPAETMANYRGLRFSLAVTGASGASRLAMAAIQTKQAAQS
jgi:hypothetical protein